MSPPKRQSITRRGFLAAMAATARLWAASPCPPGGRVPPRGPPRHPGTPIGSTDRATNQRTAEAARAATP